MVCIDSGILVLADPCHIDSVGDARPRNGLSRQIKEKLIPGGKIIPTVVTLMTGLGDGFYPVVAELVYTGESKLIKAIHIEFIPDQFWVNERDSGATSATGGQQNASS